MEIHSESLHPFSELIIGHLFDDVENARKSGDEFEIRDSCSALWYGIKALSKLGTACTGDRRGPIHWNLHVHNLVIPVARYIEEVRGVNPMDTDKELGIT
jgi:hypothetical protein